MADSGQDSAPVILPVSPANKSPATHEVDNLIADNTDVVGKIIPGTDSALFGLFKGKCSECLPSSAVTRGEESLALVCSSGFSPISRDSSSHKQPLTSLRSRASSGSGSPPRLSTPKRVSSCKLVPFHGKLIPLLPSEMLLLKDVANQSIFSLLEKPKRARSLSPKRLSKSTNKIPKVAPKKKPIPPPPPPARTLPFSGFSKVSVPSACHLRQLHVVRRALRSFVPRASRPFPETPRLINNPSLLLEVELLVVVALRHVCQLQSEYPHVNWFPFTENWSLCFHLKCFC